MSKTSIMENILKDLFFKNKTMFKYINNNDYYYIIDGDRLLTDNLKDYVNNSDWGSYLQKTNKTIDEFYNEFKINDKTYYYRNYFVDNTFASIIKKLSIDIDENKREITY